MFFANIFVLLYLLIFTGEGKMEIVYYFALPTQSFTIYTTTGAAVKDKSQMRLINNATLLGVNTFDFVSLSNMASQAKCKPYSTCMLRKGDHGL